MVFRSAPIWTDRSLSDLGLDGGSSFLSWGLIVFSKLSRLSNVLAWSGWSSGSVKVGIAMRCGAHRPMFHSSQAK